MLFSDEFLDSLPIDSVDAAIALLDRFVIWHNELLEAERVKHHAEYIEGLGIVYSFLESRGVNYGEAKLTPSEQGNINNVVSFIQSCLGNQRSVQTTRETERILGDAKERSGIRFGNIFAVEFSDEEFDRVQVLVNELRSAIAKSDQFEPKHKQRVLARLERLQAEIHKKMSSLDLIWGLLGDFGIVAGKFGEDVGPLVKRVTELVTLGYSAQARAEGMSGPLKLPFQPTTDALDAPDTEE